MRAYYFGNFYFSSIQQGIQSGHACSEMFVKYGFPPSHVNTIRDQEMTRRYDVLQTWASEHKTAVLLNGGDHDTLTELVEFMSRGDNPYPFAPFYESQCNGCLTSVAIVLTEEMYDKVSTAAGKAKISADADPTCQDYLLKVPAPMLEDVKSRNYTPWEIEFLARRVVCPLAI